jgi:hypothetical protein
MLRTRCVYALIALCALPLILHSQGQPGRRLTAPTFYIVAKGEYSKYVPDQVTIKGVSDLPPGARLSVTVYDHTGYQSSILSEDMIVTVPQDGFFDVTLKPRSGHHFQEKMVCQIDFDPNFIRQDAAVLRITGKKGELLGGSKNPQVGQKSGDNFYLQAWVDVP